MESESGLAARREDSRAGQDGVLTSLRPAQQRTHALYRPRVRGTVSLFCGPNQFYACEESADWRKRADCVAGVIGLKLANVVLQMAI